MIFLFGIWIISYYHEVYCQAHNYSILSSYSSNKEHCFESVNRCQSLSSILKNSTCFNIKLPFTYTKFNNMDIDYWSPVKAIPNCWRHLQILLCYLKYPECNQKNSFWTIIKPFRKICESTKRECSLLIDYDEKFNGSKSYDKLNPIYSIVDKTPSFLNCNKYPNCPFEPSKLKFIKNDRNQCQEPMVFTSQPSLWISDIGECSFPCKIPFFSQEEYRFTRLLFGTVGLIFFLFNLFVLVTYILHQFQFSNYKWHHMLLNLFIIHIYMIIASMGWMMQLIPNIGHSIICRNDGAIQIREPQVQIGESMLCVIVFSMIYFSLFASSLTSLSFFYSILSVISQYSRYWTEAHAINTQKNVNDSIRSSKIPFLSKKIRFSLKKADHMETFNFQDSQDKDEIKNSGIGINPDSINSRNHSLSRQLFVILISAALLIISLTIGEIKGDPLSGICFISSDSMVVRICLALLPLTVILIALSIVINITIAHMRLIQKHLNLYAINQQKIHSKRMSKTASFYLFFLILLWIFWCFSVYTHSYIYYNQKQWYESMKKQLLCKLKLSLMPKILENENDLIKCPLELRPRINVFILHNISYFTLNIMFVFCAIFNKSSVLVWKNQFLKLFYNRKLPNIVSSNDGNGIQSNLNEKIYFGLQNQSLLDSLWNPGVFVYLYYKTDNKTAKEMIRPIPIDDKTATFGSAENSSASFCIYQQDGSLRSCVSMPPINVVHQQNLCHCSKNLSRELEHCPNIDKFLKGTQHFIEQNSVRRSNSYAGKPCLVPSTPMANISIPNSCYHSGIFNQHKGFSKESFQNRNPNTQLGISCLMCSSSNGFQNNNPHYLDKSHCALLNSCNSMSNLTARRNTLDNTSKHSKSLRRFSMSIYGKNVKGISSKSTLNRRKRIARYSVSPKSITKSFTNQSDIKSHRVDHSSRNSSSFSAESYNSYNLMSQQIGGRWRDICRTRMTLHDVMIWAKAASQNHMPIHNMCQNPMCSFPHSLDKSIYSSGTHGSNLLIENKQFSSNIPLSVIFQNPDTSNVFKIGDTVQNCFNETAIVMNEKNENAQQLSDSIIFNESTNSSDKFNSEDDVVSVENSFKDADKESEEFCSDDEIVSLINSENQ